MIYLYSGTPGSGKSLHVAKDIYLKLKSGGNVICNFPVKLDLIQKKSGRRKKIGNFIYKSNDEFTVKMLYEYAAKNHVKGKEAQTLIIFDEAQVKFNPRDYSRSDRRDFINFFTVHRHLGYNVILITQMDRFLDRQIRGLVEYEIKHRKMNNFGFIGKLIPFPLFMCIEYWYGVKEKCDNYMFTYKKWYGDLYDSYVLFDGLRSDEVENEVENKLINIKVNVKPTLRYVDEIEVVKP